VGLLTLRDVPRGVLCEVASSVVSRDEHAGMKFKPGLVEIACDDPATKMWKVAVEVRLAERVIVEYGQ
jgi:hypothetical protein